MWQMPQPPVEYLDNPHWCWEFDWIWCVSSNINGNDFAGLAAMTSNFSTRETRKNLQCKLFKATLKQSYLLLCLLSNRISSSPRLSHCATVSLLPCHKIQLQRTPLGQLISLIATAWRKCNNATTNCVALLVLSGNYPNWAWSVYVVRRTGWMTGLIRESWGWLKVDLNFKHAKYPREVGVNLNT